MAYHEAFPSTSLANSEPEAKREKVEERPPSDEEVIKSTSKGYLRLYCVLLSAIKNHPSFVTD